MSNHMEDILIQLADALTDGLGNLFGWVLVMIAGFAVELYRRILRLRADVDELERYIVGDESDPDSPGLLKKVDDISSQVDSMQSEMRDQHQQTDRKLDQILDGD